MHPYATDSNERKRLPLLMVGLSILLAWSLNRGMEATGVSLPWWIDAPSVAGFYGFIYVVFDKRLWLLPPARKLGLVKIPNLNGTWTGNVNPSSEEHTSGHPAAVEITQTWRNLCVRLRTENSASHSVIGAVIVEEGEEARLSYEYINEPNAHAVGGMHMHRGTARLLLTSGDRVLEGEYYTGRDRKSHGTLRLERLVSPDDNGGRVKNPHHRAPAATRIRSGD
jgi:SMODS-associating 2TM, beta-strand rich effector domain